MADRITVLIVDDSRLFRAALAEALGSERDIVVIGSAFSGPKALEFIKLNRPDIVTLDVEMPGMDGLATLNEIKKINDAAPGDAMGVIMVSAFTQRGAQVTIDALGAGAFDFVAKPSGGSIEANIAALRVELISKIRAFIASRRRSGGIPKPTAPLHTVRRPAARSAVPRAVTIGASTGGPRALSVLLPELCKFVDLPIFIVQHMPMGFTRTLAETFARQLGRPTVEAQDAQPVEQRTVYIAPGGKHLLLGGSPTNLLLRLTDQPPENGCRPAADVLFRSAAAVLGPDAIGVILTGMGRDGTAGLSALRRAGGYIVAQDEATSAVWGMPRSAVEAGVVDQVQPLERIAQAVADWATRSKAK